MQVLGMHWSEIKNSKNWSESRARIGQRHGSACQHDCKFSSFMVEAGTYSHQYATSSQI